MTNGLGASIGGVIAVGLLASLLPKQKRKKRVKRRKKRK